MPDDHRKKKKKKGKSKKKGNENLPQGAVSVESLQFKVDITSPEEGVTEKSSRHVESAVSLHPEETVVDENEDHNDIDQRTSGESIDDLKGNDDATSLNQDSCIDDREVGEVGQASGMTNVQEPADQEDVIHDDLCDVVASCEVNEKEDDLHLTLTEALGTGPEETGFCGDRAQVSADATSVDVAIAHTVENFFQRHSEDQNASQDAYNEQGLKPFKEKKITVNVQASPWKVDNDIKEIVEHNTRTRMTKVVKTRKVIVSKADDGEDIEAVIEEENEDNPEVIGEIGTFDEAANETVEIQRVIKKRRIIVGKTTENNPGLGGKCEEEVPFEETTTITRKVLITKNEFDEDVETVIEEDSLHENQTIIDTVALNIQDDGYEIQFGEIVAESVREACHSPPKDEAKQTDILGDVDMVVPVEVATAESEVNLDDILGPADDQYEAILEQQRIDFDATRKNGKDDDDHEVYRDDDNVPRKIEMRKIINEECNELILDAGARIKDKNCDLSELKMHEMQKPAKVKITQSSKIQFNIQITDEQRQLLDEFSIPEGKSVLDDWVLVNFTAKEVVRFAEVMRMRPGWIEDSIEKQRCCKMM